MTAINENILLPRLLFLALVLASVNFASIGAAQSCCQYIDAPAFGVNTYQSVHLFDAGSSVSSALGHRGIDVAMFYWNDLLANPVGGAHQGFANAGAFYMVAELNPWKAFGWRKGITLHATISWRTGQNLSTTIGNEFNVATWFGGSTLFLDELYLQVQAADRLTLRAGRLVGEVTFATSPLLFNYVSLAIDGNPISLFANTPFPPDPFAIWGVYAKYQINRSWAVQAAIYNGNLRSRENSYHGLDFSFRNPDGVMLIGESQFTRANRGYLGHFNLGGYYIFGQETLFFPHRRRSNYGFYAVCDQQVIRRGCSTVTAWAFGLVAPIDRNEIPHCLGLGLVGRGLFRSRPFDYTNIGASWGWFSSDMRAAQALARAGGFLGPFGNCPQTYEGVVEINHWFQIKDSFALTPVVQWVINPSGFGTIPDALVMGVQISAIL